MTEAAAERLESHRYADESFTQFANRIADELDEREADDQSAACLTEAHIDDIVARTARQTAKELETRLR